MRVSFLNQSNGATIRANFGKGFIDDRDHFFDHDQEQEQEQDHEEK